VVTKRSETDTVIDNILTPLVARPVLVLVMASAVFMAWPALSAHASSDRPAGAKCIGEEGEDADEARVADDDEDRPPRFSPAFYGKTITLDASLDGLEGRALPLAIEEVCDVPIALAHQAAQLAGADAIALVRATTTVRLNGRRLEGKAATAALADADTAVLRVRLTRPRIWRADEDGERLPTFSARHIKITD
jgi:hypothetical protein